MEDYEENTLHTVVKTAVFMAIVVALVAGISYLATYLIIGA